jgi:hypothetical protein
VDQILPFSDNEPAKRTIEVGHPIDDTVSQHVLKIKWVRGSRAMSYELCSVASFRLCQHGLRPGPPERHLHCLEELAGGG